MKIEMLGRIEEMGSLEDLPSNAVAGVRFAVGDTEWILTLSFEQTREVAQAGLLFKDATITVTLEEA